MQNFVHYIGKHFQSKAFLTRELPDNTQGTRTVLYCDLNKAEAGNNGEFRNIKAENVSK